MIQSRLTIGRLASRYVVARGHPDPAAIAGRFDGAARALPGHLASFLAQLAAQESDAVWLFRSIEVEITLNAGTDPSALAAAWAQVLARSILARLNGGAEGVVFFADRAAYLASFVRDLAEGDAWSLWYYGPFDGLQALPIAAALRTALLAQPAQGRHALLLLAPWQTARVLAALSANEAAAVLAELDISTGESPPETATIAEAVIAAWRGAADFGVCPERLALGCWLAIVRHAPETVGNGAASLARALAALRLALVHGISRVTDSLCSANLPALYGAVGPAQAERLGPLLHLPEAVRRTLVAMPERADCDPTPAPRDTPFGGLFLLLPLLAALPFNGLDQLPVATANLLRFLVVASCAGDDAAAAFLDPVWRDLFSLPAQLLLADLAAWAAELPAELLGSAEAAEPRPPADMLGSMETAESGPPTLPPCLAALLAAAAAAVLTSFARALPGFAASSADYLRRNFLNCRARVTFAADVILVELGRPPLDLVLGITGMTRERLCLPWLDARAIQLRPLERGAET